MAALTVISRKPIPFVIAATALVGALLGVLMGMSMGSAPLGLIVGAVISAGLSYVATTVLSEEKTARYALIAVSLIAGGYFLGLVGAVFGALWGWFFGWFTFWLFEGRYRARLHPYLTPGQVLWHYAFRIICGLIFAFLIIPIIVVMPLSFNAEDFFTFTPEMLRFDPAGYSLKHYRDFFTNPEWQRSFKNSLMIAPIATLVSVSLGTLAAIGLSQSHVPAKRAIMSILISPMVPTAFGPRSRAILSTASTTSENAARASLRSGIGVVPAWLAKPAIEPLYHMMPWPRSTTPMVLFSASNSGPCSMCNSTKALNFCFPTASAPR